MSRIARMLPADRADYSFGDLIYWHLFVYGTRPTGDPAAASGREWDAASFCRKLNIADRTLRNWMAHRNLPVSAGEIATVLFGDNPLFDGWRFELSEALRAARLEKSRKSRSGFRSETDQASDDVVDADAANQPEPTGDGDETAGMGPKRDHRDGEQRAPSKAVVPYLRGRDEDARTGQKVGAIRLDWSSRSAGNRSRVWSQRSAGAFVSGLVILIGLYAWTRLVVPHRSGPP